MRLHKCNRVLNYLIENKIVDDRQIWCYAQMKAKIKIKEDPIKIHAMVLMCIKGDSLFLYNTAYNSTELELMYSCRIDKMENVCIKKKLFSTILCFSNGEEDFRLEMDDWKRFSVFLNV